ncbi:serine kinase [bacterium]|nr:serine kinase [bacterium]MBU0899261.1 serine kinase [bacterium]MBU1154006.1 serine kinase [bacterium]MBU1782640.1 serine kinase [bacterium]MBU2599357.1 serine kinase [bacterium]
MNLQEVVSRLNLEVKSGFEVLTNEVNGGYVSDLLSDVMANAQKGNIWVTLQIHQNIVAVADLKELAGIILVGARQPEEDTLQKAVQKKIPILVSKMSAFEIVGKLYQFGIRYD